MEIIYNTPYLSSSSNEILSRFSKKFIKNITNELKAIFSIIKWKSEAQLVIILKNGTSRI